jgi:hypothetical protein
MELMNSNSSEEELIQKILSTPTKVVINEKLESYVPYSSQVLKRGYPADVNYPHMNVRAFSSPVVGKPTTDLQAGLRQPQDLQYSSHHYSLHHLPNHNNHI